VANHLTALGKRDSFPSKKDMHTTNLEKQAFVDADLNRRLQDEEKSKEALTFSERASPQK
jgi:hypothetical protein